MGSERSQDQSYMINIKGSAMVFEAKVVRCNKDAFSHAGTGIIIICKFEKELEIVQHIATKCKDFWPVLNEGGRPGSQSSTVYELESNRD